MEAEPLFETRQISKTYPGVRALIDVDFTLQEGEIHALVGVNGAGKSTLVKVITGAVLPDAGTMYLRGRITRPRNVAEAMDQGIVVVHQERTLIPHFTAAENIFLGQEPTHGGIIDSAALRAQAVELTRRLGVNLQLDEPVKNLGAGERQLVDILKALRGDPAVIILDEPTAALSKVETERLFDLLRTFTVRGIGVVFVSHRLDEVFAIADRITVLRDGQRITTSPTSQLTKQEVIRFMVNREVTYEAEVETGRSCGRPLLELKSLCGERFEEVNLVVCAGEVVGLAGVVGAGRTELLETIVGFRRRSAGKVFLRGREVSIRSPEQAVSWGIVLIPEKRTEKGLIERLTVCENIVMPSLARFCHLGVVSGKEETIATQSVVDTLQITTPSLDFQARNLSGGNKQKVVFGKWLLASQDVSEKVFLFDEPTEGVDVGVKAEMWEIIRDLASRGAGVLIASSELEELTYLSDRVYVMREGCIVGEEEREKLTHDQLLNWMLIDASSVPEAESEQYST